MFPEFQRFITWLRCRSPRATTHVHYASDLRCFFAWAGKGPEAITLHDVDAYVATCRQLGHAPATINRRLAALRCLYRFLALEADDAPPCPVLPRRHHLRRGRRPPRAVGDDDLQRLLAAIQSSRAGPAIAARDRAMVLLMLRCGLRVCEVQRLSLCDLELQASPGCPPRLRLRGKNDAQRFVFLSPQVVAALAEWLDLRPHSDDPALFLSCLGRRLSTGGIQARLACYSRRAGVRITCHMLRHTFGRHMVRAGMPVTSIQRLLGHRRIRTTQTYLYLSQRQLQAEYDAAMARVSRWLSPGPGIR